jgi:hypothetical protein
LPEYGFMFGNICITTSSSLLVVLISLSMRLLILHLSFQVTP